jgi:hypothetical protein
MAIFLYGVISFVFLSSFFALQVDWNIPFQALVEFKNKHGHTNVPEKTPYGGACLHFSRFLKGRETFSR